MILPHEDVMAAPVDDRAVLMRTTQTNLEPILLAHAGQRPAARARPDAAAGPPAGRLRRARRQRATGCGASPTRRRTTAVAEELLATQALIADGHHRYAAYLRLQDELRDRRPAGASPWDSGLAMLVDQRTTPPRRADPPLGGRADDDRPRGASPTSATTPRACTATGKPPSPTLEPTRTDARIGRPSWSATGTPGRCSASPHPRRRRRGAARDAAAGLGDRGRAGRLPPQPRPGPARHQPRSRASWSRSGRPRPRRSAPARPAGSGCPGSRRRSARSRAWAW